MLNINRILFPTDLSETAEGAFGYAIQLAKTCGAEIHVLNVRAPRTPETDGAFAFVHAEDESAGIWSEANRTVDLKGGVRVVHAQVHTAPVVQGITEYAAQEGMDVIVMGTHGRGGLARLFLGGVTSGVAQKSCCPVLAVHENAREDVPKMKTILAAVDFSRYSRSVVEAASDLARSFGAELFLLHVLEVPDIMPDAALLPIVPPDVTGVVREAQERLVRDVEGLDLRYKVDVRVGDAAVAIAECAEEIRANLIVLASHGHTGLGRLLMGGTTERILEVAGCPVFIVKSEGSRHVSEKTLPVASSVWRSDQVEER